MRKAAPAKRIPKAHKHQWERHDATTLTSQDGSMRVTTSPFWICRSCGHSTGNKPREAPD